MALTSDGVPEPMMISPFGSGGLKRGWPFVVRSTFQPCAMAAFSMSRRSNGMLAYNLNSVKCFSCNLRNVIEEISLLSLAEAGQG